jgi:hypothetical protein
VVSALQIIRELDDRLSMDKLKALSDRELVEAEDLLHHWQSVAASLLRGTGSPYRDEEPE